MRIFKTAEGLQQFLDGRRSFGKTVGFVPTMGALHAGHMSLIEACRKDADVTVCSIFVNPTQFNNPEDFKHYPITLEKDVAQLLKKDCDVLFLPSITEVYPSHHQKRHYSLGVLETVLEGAFRPGHFQGVCQVMDRLLQMVQPQHLFMGQKDFQQCMVVSKLLQITHRAHIKLHVAPTLREGDGLAMSSRNLRLKDGDRKKVPIIYDTLQWVQKNLHAMPVNVLETKAAQQLADAGLIVDYVAIRNAASLSTAQNEDAKVALVAASIGGIRLIDNLPLN